MALISVALRLLMGLAFLYLPALIVGRYLSARFVAPRSIVIATAAGFVFMSVVWWSRGAGPWWYAAAAGALFAVFAGGGAILARWPL